MNTTMTTDEKLDLILKEMQGMRADIRAINTNVDTLKTAQEQTDHKIVGINNDINTMKGDITDIKTKLDTHITECDKRMTGRYMKHSFLTDGWTMPGLVNTTIAVVAAVGGYNLFSEKQKQKCE